MATIDTVKKVLALLSQTRPGTDLGAVSVEAYHLVLASVPDPVLERVAILAARQPGAFLPSAGDLYDAALNLLDNQPGVEEAWALVWELAQGQSLELPERAAKALQAIGGIPPGGWLTKDVPSYHREFIRAYEAELQRWKRQMSLPGVRLLGSNA